MTTNSLPAAIIRHATLEENLQAAKQAVKAHRNAYIMRHTDMGADVIDVICGQEIIERHISTEKIPYTPPRRSHPICVENTALYQ